MQVEIEVQSFFKGCHPKEPYDADVLALLDPEGFNEFVQHIYHNSEMVETKCYEKAEELFNHYFKRRRYEDYNSYKSSYHQVRTLKRQKKNMGIVARTQTAIFD